MTAQVDDVFRMHTDDFALAGISGGELFDPSLLDLHPVYTCTACYRGYLATYALLDSRLVLADLDVNLYSPTTAGERFEPIVGPEINGVVPTRGGGMFELFNNHYTAIDHHLEYTGGLLIADGFIRELYVHMGFHPAWKYQKVIELVFEGGRLKQQFDRSSRMAKVRERVANADPTSPFDTPASILKFIEDSFDRTYHR